MFEDESWLNFGKTADWEFPGDGTAIYQPITGSQERIVYVVEVPSLG
jgi:hypothetical protein